MIVNLFNENILRIFLSCNAGYHRTGAFVMLIASILWVLWTLSVSSLSVIVNLVLLVFVIKLSLLWRPVRRAVEETGVWVCPVIVSLSDSWTHDIQDCESFLSPSNDSFQTRYLEGKI